MRAAHRRETGGSGTDADGGALQELRRFAAVTLDGAGAQLTECRDPVVREVLQGKLPLVLRYITSKTELTQLLSLLVELAALDHGDCLAVAANLEYLLERLSAGGLRRWIVTGLRCYPERTDRRTRYFRLEDDLAARSLAFEEAGNVFQRFRPYLQFYVDGFAGRHVELKTRSGGPLNGPPMRTVITDQEILLPEGFSIIDGGDGSDLYRAAVAHAVAHLRYSPRRLDVGTLKPMSIAVISLIEDARVEYLMKQHYPGLYALWGKLLSPRVVSDLTFRSLAMRLAKGIHDSGYSDENYWVNKGIGLFMERIADPTNYAAFREIGSILANDLGQMRVRFDPSQYVPEPAYRDDNSMLWDYGDTARSPPSEDPLVLQGFQLESLEKQDEVPAEPNQTRPDDMVLLETEERAYYGEWDYKTETERSDWITVISKQARLGRPRQLDVSIPRHRSDHSIFSLVKANQVNRSEKMARQWEGDQLDLNAAIAAQVDLRSGLVPDPRVFAKPGRRSPRPSVLVLLDLSESTNDRIFGRFDTVLDLAKGATVILCEAIRESVERFAVHGFSSNGRHEVEYFRVKDFDEPFGQAQVQRILGLEGGHSTRIGAAMRHAGTLAATEAAERKLLLVLTDGEPSDVDVFDPEYLIEDAARVTRELRGDGVTIFCLTLDKRAEKYVARIFGRNYLIVDDPVELPLQLSRVFVRLLNS